MPAKTTAKAKPQDLETVVQIALDAADAAMDVTSEFARISTEFQKAKNTFGRLEKTVKITALAVGGLLFVGVLLVGLLLARTADKMNVLTATNTELLTVFTENISMMNDGVGSLQGPFSQLATLQEQLETMAPKIAEISAASDAVTEKLSGMDQAFEEIKLLQSDQAAAVTAQIDTSLTSNLADILDQLDERISMLNGELAMATTENIDSALKEQAMLFSEVTTEFMAVIREGLNQDDPEADRKMQALMDTQSKLEERIGELNMRLLKASQRPKPKAEAVKRQAAARAPSQDVIKFP
jgi:chaperonin cofactor prefoldin